MLYKIEKLCKLKVGQKYYNLELSFLIFPDSVGLELTTLQFFSRFFSIFPKIISKTV